MPINLSCKTACFAHPALYKFSTLPPLLLKRPSHQAWCLLRNGNYFCTCNKIACIKWFFNMSVNWIGYINNVKCYFWWKKKIAFNLFRRFNVTHIIEFKTGCILSSFSSVLSQAQKRAGYHRFYMNRICGYLLTKDLFPKLHFIFCYFLATLLTIPNTTYIFKKLYWAPAFCVSLFKPNRSRRHTIDFSH